MRGLKISLYAGLCFVASIVDAKSSALGIKNGKVAVTSPDGLHDATYSLEVPKPLSSPISLDPLSTLKITFNTIETTSGELTLPQQAHILFEDPKGEDVTIPMTVKGLGRASFALNMAKPINALLHNHGTLQMTLLLSTLDTSIEPLHYPFGTLVLPESSLKALPSGRHDLPPRQGEPAFQPEQELFHTFREDEKSVGFVKSAMGTGLVLSPWIVFLALFTQVSPKLEYKSPPASAQLFFVSLAALEGLIMVYWIGLTLEKLLAIFIPLSLVSAYTGKVALGSLRRRRIQGK